MVRFDCVATPSPSQARSQKQARDVGYSTAEPARSAIVQKAPTLSQKQSTDRYKIYYSPPMDTRGPIKGHRYSQLPGGVPRDGLALDQRNQRERPDADGGDEHQTSENRFGVQVVVSPQHEGA